MMFRRRHQQRLRWLVTLVVCLFLFSIDQEPEPVLVQVHVLAWRRVRSLQRLWASLESADYAPVDGVRRLGGALTVHLDGEPSPSVSNWIREQQEKPRDATRPQWPFESWVLTAESRHRGLKSLILSLRFPQSRPDGFSLILEDDLQVSPLYWKYLDFCVRALRDGRLAAQWKQRHGIEIIGCSLYTPRVNEIAETEDPQHPPDWKPSDIIGMQRRFFLFQLPCSWGSLVSVSWWNRFLDFAQERVSVSDQLFPAIPGLRSHLWTHSWKKYMIEFFYLNKLVLLYPSFPHEQSFSTNHYEEGVHTRVPSDTESGLSHSIHDVDTLRSDKEWQDDRFTVPLLAKNHEFLVERAFQAFLRQIDSTIPLINVHHEKTMDLEPRQDWLMHVDTLLCQPGGQFKTPIICASVRKHLE